MRNIKNKSFGREEGSPWSLSFLCNGEILGSQQQVNRRNKGNCLKKKKENNIYEEKRKQQSTRMEQRKSWNLRAYMHISSSSSSSLLSLMWSNTWRIYNVHVLYMLSFFSFSKLYTVIFFLLFFFSSFILWKPIRTKSFLLLFSHLQ